MRPIIILIMMAAAICMFILHHKNNVTHCGIKKAQPPAKPNEDEAGNEYPLHRISMRLLFF